MTGILIIETDFTLVFNVLRHQDGIDLDIGMGIDVGTAMGSRRAPLNSSVWDILATPPSHHPLSQQPASQPTSQPTSQ